MLSGWLSICYTGNTVKLITLTDKDFRTQLNNELYQSSEINIEPKKMSEAMLRIFKRSDKAEFINLSAASLTQLIQEEIISGKIGVSCA